MAAKKKKQATGKQTAGTTRPRAKPEGKTASSNLRAGAGALSEPASSAASMSPADLPAVEAVDLTVGATAVSLALAPTLLRALQEERKAPIGILSHVQPTQTAQDVPGSPPEPVYGPSDQDDIQGNTIPGFNKDHQVFLFYSFGRRKTYPQAKKFLRWLVPYLSSMEEVIAFRRLFRLRRHRVGKDHSFLCASWVNIGFAQPGLAKLVGAEADTLGDEAFQRGLAERSTYLGDPGQPRAPGHAARWVVGGPKNPADAVIIVAGDSPSMLADLVTLIKARAEDHGLRLLFEQRGQTLPGRLRGHEHFGFRDGISQPGVRGKLSSAGGDYITPRYIHPTDPRRLYFAKPGQLLVWPGQFLLGEPRQSSEHLYNQAASTASSFPPWARRGSYMVVRRLHQDVLLFWRVVKGAAERLSMDPTKLASMLVGRWPSGAPLSRSPAADNPALAGDEFANNHFLFDDDTRPSQLQPIPGYGGDSYGQASADFLATVCPHFAHVRKVNPRDSVTDLGKPEDNLTRAILRRGIPYGPTVLTRSKGKAFSRLSAQERGLMFVGYCSSIEDQFEFLQRRWANSPVQPNFGGHDPIIGQNGGEPHRIRFVDFPKPSGGTLRLKLRDEWVIPTGGGYFFSPTISAVRDVLAT